MPSMRKGLAGSSSRQSTRGVAGERRGSVRGLAGADPVSCGVSRNWQQGQDHSLSFSGPGGRGNLPELPSCCAALVIVRPQRPRADRRAQRRPHPAPRPGPVLLLGSAPPPCRGCGQAWSEIRSLSHSPGSLPSSGGGGGAGRERASQRACGKRAVRESFQSWVNFLKKEWVFNFLKKNKNFYG